MKNIHLVIGCTHVPFQNKKMMNGVLQLAKDLKPKLAGFHIVGDFHDLNSLSGHDKGKMPLPGIDLTYEYKEANKVLNDIDSVTKGAQKTFLYGNHEHRYLRELKYIDNFKYGRELKSPEEATRLRERGYEVKTDYMNDYFVLGDHLQLFHGYYSTIHPAKQHLNKLKKSCMFAHTHTVDSYHESDMASFNIGWGGDVRSEAFNYANRATKSRWINGFGVVTIDNNGFFHAHYITVFNDTFFYNGKRYGR